MASLRDIRKRIRSVRNTQKITGAMKLVAASKLRRSQERMMASRPYAHRIRALLGRVCAHALDQETAVHPLLSQRPQKRVVLVVMTSDRGLCGGFNNNIFKRVEVFLRDETPDLDSLQVAGIGRRAYEFFARRKIAGLRQFNDIFADLRFAHAQEMAQAFAQDFVTHELDSVYLLYNEFKSVISQKVTLRKLLPIDPAELPPREAGAMDYIYEASRTSVLEELLPHYLAITLWHCLLESYAAEHAARMAAMDSATRNARDLVDSLSLQYNRARQATITRELLDIVGGAEALAG